MKKLLIVLTLCAAAAAQAQHRPYPHHHSHAGHNHGWGWMVPAIIGGAVVYSATRPSPPTVVYVPSSYPPAPPGFRYEQILDANCNCYRWVLVQG